MPSQARKATLEALNKLYKTSKYADLTLQCGSKTFKAHRAIVCMCSPVFETECDGPFTEAQSKTIVVGAEAATASSVAKMLEYLYSRDYDDSKWDEEEMISAWSKKVAEDEKDTDTVPPSLLVRTRLLNNVRMFALADYYQIEDLKQVAYAKFTLALSSVGSQKSPNSNDLDNEHRANLLTDVIYKAFEYISETDTLPVTLVSYVAQRPIFVKNAVFMEKVSGVHSFMAILIYQLVKCHEDEVTQHANAWAENSKAFEDDIRQLKNKNTNLLREKITLSNKVSAHQNEKSSLNDRITTLENEKKALSNKNSSLQQDKLELERKIAGSKKGSKISGGSAGAKSNAQSVLDKWKDASVQKCQHCGRDHDKIEREDAKWIVLCGGCSKKRF